MIRTVFMGSCDFSKEVLYGIGPHIHCIGVFTAPASKGRKTPVQTYAEAQGWPVYTPSSLRLPSVKELLTSLRPDIILVASYGLFLPPSLLSLPPKGCLNLHPSLLPRWRGASPMVSSILHGDRQTGICLMLMDEGMDTGPVLWKKELTLSLNETTPSLSKKLAYQGVEILKEALPLYLNGHLLPSPQLEEGVTFAAKIKKEEGLLDPSDDAYTLHRKIRAFMPWPSTWIKMGSSTLHITEALPEQGNGLPSGLLYVGEKPHTLIMTCGKDTHLSLLRVKPEGRKEMDYRDFIRGYGSLLTKKETLFT